MFSMAVSNSDDHFRNHGFILSDEGWELSTLYDVNPDIYGEYLSLNVDADNSSIDFELAVQAAPYYGIGKKYAVQEVDKIKNTVQIRTRRPGDRIQVQSGGGHKKLKDYLIDSKIPQNQRDSLVLLADGKEIIWVVGMRISEAYKITQETKRILSMCVNGGEEKNE